MQDRLPLWRAIGKSIGAGDSGTGSDAGGESGESGMGTWSVVGIGVESTTTGSDSVADTGGAGTCSVPLLAFGRF